MHAPGRCSRPRWPDLGWEGLPLTPFSIAVRPDASERLVGVLWYEVGDMDGEIGVASADLVAHARDRADDDWSRRVAL